MPARTDMLAEFRSTLGIAAPLAGANVAQMTMAFINLAMVGRLGGVPLAAAGLGAALYFTSGLILQGIISAVAPLAAHAVGIGDRRGAARIGGAGLVVALALCLPLIFGALIFDDALVAFGYDPVLAGEVGRYLHAIVWGAPAFFCLALVRNLLAAASRTRPVMAVLVFGIAASATLNWVLIFGRFGLPAFGVAGSGYASAVNQWLMLAALALCLAAVPGLGVGRLLASALAWPGAEMRQVLRLGAPIAGIVGLEMAVFLTTGILMGLLGPDALAAHQMVLNIASLTFMVPLGIGQAATVRVAVTCGAGRRDAARRACLAALGLGAAFMATMALVFWTAPLRLIAIYLDTGSAENWGVVAVALRLLAIAAFFQLFDGTQTIAAGALRGYRDTTVPMVLAAVGYWGIGFVGGWLLAFPLGLGAVGLWWGLALGLATVALLLTLRLHFVALPRRYAAAPAST